ncbi:HNH endonuclease signature motif containing protein [Yimella sp. cx-51]|uniref:HNH endonuclease signature motif containing protein n=1 Tax=Yimella sp. cx-51 TaxID=2770551 RepID=UPI00165E9249|nr:HNH endonuclease signature motif containing protein [Yimella sp. cx-51]MBC9955669.1 HNH endonuclease [Yimella sp. cx-51]QTH37760.1 HNH endonuclease [Yimella sp. cx-51]
MFETELSALGTLRAALTDPDRARFQAITRLLTQQGDPLDLLRAAETLARHAYHLLDADAVRSQECSVTGAAVSTDDRHALEDVIKQAATTATVTQAAQTIALARYSAIDETVIDSDTGYAGFTEHPLGHHAPWADTELAAACQWSTRAAASRLTTAAAITTATPTMLAMSAAGDLELWRAKTVAIETACASAETAARVEQHLLATRGWDTWGYQKLQNTTRALIAQWEADALRAKRQQTVREATGVHVYPSTIAGLAELHVTGPTEQIAEIHAALEHLARHRDATGDNPIDPATGQKKTLGQLRVDALHDLVTAGCDISYQVMVHVPVTRQQHQRPCPGCGAPGESARTNDATSSTQPPPDADPAAPRGPDPRCHRHETGASPTTTAAPNGHTTPKHCDHTAQFVADERERPADAGRCASEPDQQYRVGWATVAGIGHVHPGAVRALMNAYGAKLSRALIDAETGITIETAETNYRPSPALRRYVEQRDGSCRAPGCDRPATSCDLDHITPWPTGRTTARNLAALCRYHHRAKTQGIWSYTMTDNGDCHWTSRTGNTYTTHPASTYEQAAG